MYDKERLRKLTELDIKITDALLGEMEKPQDLLDLQKAVRSEIRKLTSGIMVG